MGFGKDGKGVIIRSYDTITLGALGAPAVKKQDNALVLGEDFRMIKSEIYAHLFGAAFVEGDGPLLIGIANNELTATEIDECLAVDGPLDRNDRLSEERAMRAVFPLFLMPNDVGNNLVEGNYGKPHTDTIRWTFSNPEGWTVFAGNIGTGALTTGGVIILQQKYYGVWVT